MACFFDVVHITDSAFTYQACETFLKHALENSTRRSEIEGDISRSSVCKRRLSRTCIQQSKKARRRKGRIAKKNSSSDVTSIAVVTSKKKSDHNSELTDSHKNEIITFS